MNPKKIMKHSMVLLTAFSLFTLSFSRDSSSTYLDGNYYGSSQGKYINETYWGHAWINVAGGSFTSINFFIRDSLTHENVDSVYGIKHFSDNPAYMDQCVNDGNGIYEYPRRLLRYQNLDNITAISGATWSYKIFMASVRAALSEAKIPVSIRNRLKTESRLSGISSICCSGKDLVYCLSQQSQVKLSIYDSQGKCIKLIHDGSQEAGLHSIAWGQYVTSGVYFLKIMIDNTITSIKMVKN